MGRRGNIYRIICLKLVGIGILLWLLSQTDIEHVGTILARTDPFLVLLSLSLLFIHLLVKFSRFKYLLARVGIVLSFKKTVHYSLAANYLSFITPGRVGELSKAYFIHKNNCAPLNKLFACSVVDRLFDAYVLIQVSLVGLALSGLFSNINSIICFVIFCLFSAFPFLLRTNWGEAIMPRLVQQFMINRFRTNTLFAHLKNFLFEVAGFFDVGLIVGVQISVVAYVIFFASCYVMSTAIEIPLSFLQISFFVACTTILSFLPISFAGIGTRDASLVFLFSTECINSESALAFSTLIFMLTYIFFGLVGFVCFMSLDDNYKKLETKL